MGVSITFDHLKIRIPELFLHAGAVRQANAWLNFGSLSLFEFTPQRNSRPVASIDLTRRCGGDNARIFTAYQWQNFSNLSILVIHKKGGIKSS
jgi:hypothetical protein